MIETDGGGSITVRVCSDPANPGATLTIPVESAGDHDAAQDQHCPWGALAVAPIVPDTPALPETLARAAPFPAAAPLLGHAPRLAPPLPPPHFVQAAFRAIVVPAVSHSGVSVSYQK